MVNIIEKISISKTGAESDNEDGIFISDSYIAVIDGATSKESDKYGGLTGGQAVRNIIMDSLGDMNGGESFVSGVKKIQSDIEREFPASKYFHASASAIIYNIKKRSIWLVGDCQAIVNGKKYTNYKIVDEILSQARAMALTAYKEDGMSDSELAANDIGREMILPFLKLQHKFENKSGRFGYIAFNNAGMQDSILNEKGIIIDVPEHSEIILASDGYPCLMNSLESSEKELAEIAASDPLCYMTNFSTKGILKGNICYDDRTYIRFTI